MPITKERPWYSVEELAEYLGVPVSTVRQWRYRKQGPAGRKFGRHVRYHRDDASAWCNAQQVTGADSASEIRL